MTASVDFQLSPVSAVGHPSLAALDAQIGGEGDVGVGFDKPTAGQLVEPAAELGPDQG